MVFPQRSKQFFHVLKQWRFDPVEDEIWLSRRIFEIWNPIVVGTTTLDSVGKKDSQNWSKKPHELLKDFLCDECFYSNLKRFWGNNRSWGNFFLALRLMLGGS